MELDQQIEKFSRRLAGDPHSRVFAPLADLLRKAGRLEDALELVDDGLGRHPGYVSALVIKGRILLDAGRGDQARQVLVRVLELDPENFVVLRLLAEDARSRGAWTDAIPLLEKLVVLDPDDRRWAGALAEAKQLAGQAQEAHAGTASFATMTLVDIYLAQGYRAKALEALTQMAVREPGRQDIQQRIVQVQAEGPSLGESPDHAVTREPELPAEEIEQRRTAHRDLEKKQFVEWINRIRQEGDSAP
jgi:predicted Zn-dependent protease